MIEEIKLENSCIENANSILFDYHMPIDNINNSSLQYNSHDMSRVLNMTKDISSDNLLPDLREIV